MGLGESELLGFVVRVESGGVLQRESRLWGVGGGTSTFSIIALVIPWGGMWRW